MARIVFQVSVAHKDNDTPVRELCFRDVTPQDFDKEVMDLPLDCVLVIRQKII